MAVWRPPVLAATVLAVTAVAGAACGSSAHPSGARSSGATSSAPVTRVTGIRITGPSVAQIERARQVTVGGKTVAVPTEIGTHPISPAIDDGQQIIISAAGFLPRRLFSTPDEPVTWTNLTDEPQRVIFDYFPVRSPVIAPGGTFSWTSMSTLSIAYKTASGLRGVDTVNPPFG
jgi:hypothetical protein